MLYSSLFQGDLAKKKGKCGFGLRCDREKVKSGCEKSISPDLALQIFVDEIFLKVNYVAIGGLCPFENSPRFGDPYSIATWIQMIFEW